MSASKRVPALVVAVLGLLLAACGQASTPDTATTTVPATPDAVATAFADAYAAGDTPTACTFATGTALAAMTRSGWCAPQARPWAAVSYWPGTRCEFPDGMGDLSGVRLYAFHTSGQVAQYPDFIVELTGTGTTWHVTMLGQDGPATRSANQLCSIATKASSAASTEATA